MVGGIIQAIKGRVSKALAFLGALASCATIAALLWGDGIIVDRSVKAPLPAVARNVLQTTNSPNSNVVVGSAAKVEARSLGAPNPVDGDESNPPIQFLGQDDAASSYDLNPLTVRRGLQAPMFAGQHITRLAGESIILNLRVFFTSTFHVNSGCMQVYYKQKPYYNNGKKVIACEGYDESIFAKSSKSFSVVALQDLDVVLERVDFGDHTRKL